MFGESHGHKEASRSLINDLQDLLVLGGSLEPLRTKAEVEASYEIKEAYVVQAPAKSTAVVLRLAWRSTLTNVQLILPKSYQTRYLRY